MPQVRMDPIERILERLTKYPDLDYESTPDNVTILPVNQGGFSVSFQIDGDQYQVNLGGWHEHFDDADEALNCFTFGLSSECRLKITSCGKIPCRWTVQSKENGEWVDDSTTGLLFFPFWKARSVSYKQNKHISGGA